MPVGVVEVFTQLALNAEQLLMKNEVPTVGNQKLFRL